MASVRLLNGDSDMYNGITFRLRRHFAEVQEHFRHKSPKSNKENKKFRYSQVHVLFSTHFLKIYGFQRCILRLREEVQSVSVNLSFTLIVGY